MRRLEQGKALIRTAALSACLGLLACLVPLSSAGTPAPAAAASRARTCQQSGSRTILATRALRVFRTRRHYDPNYATGAHVDYVYACWRRTGRRTRIDIETPDGYFTEQVIRVESASPSSRVIAFETQFSGRSGDENLVRSVDVRRGRVLHDDSRDMNRYSFAARNFAVSAFIVTPSGSLAWIGSGSCPSGADLGADGVYAIGTDNHEHRLQCGDPNGNYHSRSDRSAFSRLRYSRGVVSWTGPGGRRASRLR